MKEKKVQEKKEKVKNFQFFIVKDEKLEDGGRFVSIHAGMNYFALGGKDFYCVYINTKDLEREQQRIDLLQQALNLTKNMEGVK
jgi:hypothetical protein